MAEDKNTKINNKQNIVLWVGGCVIVKNLRDFIETRVILGRIKDVVKPVLLVFHIFLASCRLI